MEWINIKNSKPEDESLICIVNIHGETISGFVNGHYLDTHDGIMIDMNDAVFWIPLKEPPRN